MTPEMRKTVDEVERLDRAATKGPWYRTGPLSEEEACSPGGVGASLAIVDDDGNIDKVVKPIDLLDDISVSNLDAIAAFRTTAPILSAEVVRLDERERQWIRGVLRWECPSCAGLGFSPDFDNDIGPCFGCKGTGNHPDAIALLARMGLTVEQARTIAEGAE